MRSMFNNIYTPCLRKILTGPGYTPPSGKTWEQMVKPFIWEVHKWEHAKRYRDKKRKFVQKYPDREYPEYEPEPDEPSPLHPIPVRTEKRSNFFTYFLTGPMSKGLFGYDTAFQFDLLNTPSTTDRSTTSRKAQRLRKKRRR